MAGRFLKNSGSQHSWKTVSQRGREAESLLDSGGGQEVEGKAMEDTGQRGPVRELGEGP